LSTFNSYLRKRGITEPWNLSPIPMGHFQQTIVIPAYSEFNYLPKTLDSINQNKLDLLKSTLVVVVVNNGINSPEKVKKNNQLTFDNLKSKEYHFSLSMVDATSSGIELPEKHTGVGLARKIGIDLALPYLKSPQSLIFCTDADTIVSPDYLSIVRQYFHSRNISAAVVGFRHLVSEDSKLNDAISLYEKFLKHTAKNMKDAGSPYGYVAMGSTMVCSAEAYCAVGGMPRKKATEDFYFLQELAKYCVVETIPEVLVYPSPRPISRVYLGTGYRMEQVEKGFNIQSLQYSEKSYSILKKWLKLGSNAWKIEISKILNSTLTIHLNLSEFLTMEGIEEIWDKIQRNAPSESHFNEQFHRWFDGLKTIRFLKRFSS